MFAHTRNIHYSAYLEISEMIGTKHAFLYRNMTCLTTLDYGS